MTQPTFPVVKIIPKSWADMVKRAEGEEYNRPEPAYEFSDRKFIDTGGASGIYTPS